MASRGGPCDHRGVSETGPRAGFVLYVGLPDDGSPAVTPTELVEAAEALRELAQEALPNAETLTALSLSSDPGGEVQAIGERLGRLEARRRTDEADSI